MRDAPPQAIRLQDYKPPAFLVSKVALDVDIQEGQATVHATLKVERNAARAESDLPLVLDGDALELLSVSLDGRTLAAGEYEISPGHLTIRVVPQAFTLETVVRFDPWKNTSLEGLYAGQSGLVTQCAAEGFRRMTYFVVRPDVLATYVVPIYADKARFPRHLAHGSLSLHGRGMPHTRLLQA